MYAQGDVESVQVAEDTAIDKDSPTVWALIVNYIILGVPYYNDSTLYPKPDFNY